MDEEAPLRFYGCGINSFFQLGPLVSECPSQSAGAAAQASDDGSGAIIQGQNIHFSSQEKKSVLHLPQPLALERYVAEEDGLVQDIACGATFTIALTSRGVPYQWGTVNGRAYPEPSRVSLGVPLRCLQVSCGRKHALALMEGGFVTSWGVGYFGQLGQGDNLSSDRPRLIHHLDPPRLGGDRVVAVACGGQHSAVHTAGQSVFCFGFNRYGQVGQGQACNKISTPRPVNMSGIGSSQIRQLVCGRHHTSVLTDKGQVFSWGASSFGRLGLPDPKKIVGLPTEVPAFRCCPLAALACGDFHVLGLGVDGRAYAWGYGSEGQGGLGATLHLRTPRPVEGLEGSRIAQIACGAWWSMVVTEAGRLYTWGYGDGGWLGLERASKLPYVEPCPPVTKYGATCSFDSDFNACLPAVVSTLSHLRVEKVVAGGGHTIIMARRIQRRFSRAERKVVQGFDGHEVGEGRAGEQDRRARGGEDVPYALMESISLADAAGGTRRDSSETGEMGMLGMEGSVPHTSRHANRASSVENANESTSSSSTSSSSFSSSSHAPASVMPST